jgi:hypothetical protein
VESPTIFEKRQRHLLWRIGMTEHQGKRRLSIWPWYSSDDGEWRPCSPRFGGGFQIELTRVPELIDTLQAIMAEGGDA